MSLAFPRDGVSQAGAPSATPALRASGQDTARDATPGTAVARALADLRSTLDGTYGDEGGEVERRLGDLSAAVTTWDRTIAEAERILRPQMVGATPEGAAFAHETLASAYMERGRFADALTELEAASRVAPQRASLHRLRGFALDAMGSPDAAAAAFRQAWVVAPDDDPLAAYLGVTRSALDDAELTRASNTLLRTVQAVSRGESPQPTARGPSPGLSAGLSPLEPGGAPLFPLAHYAEGFALAARGEFSEGIGRIRQAAGSDPLGVDPASQSGGLRQAADLLRRGSLRAALAALEQTVKASPRSSEAHRMLATASALAGDVRSSVAHLESALRIRPDDERSWIALASVHADAGALVEAARTLEKAVAAIPESGGLRWRLAAMLVRIDQPGDALVRYGEAERLPPLSGRATVHQAVTTLASLQQDIARAAAAGEQRVRVNLADAAAHRDLAGVYEKQGRQDQAFAELAIAAWLDPDDPATLVALGRSLMAARLDADAVAALERAVTLQPDFREARYALAQALTRTSRRAEAERHLAEFERQRAEAVARERRDLDIAAARDDAARQSAAGQHAQAAATWKKVIALEPARAQNHLEMAEALVKAGRLTESLPYFVKTAELDGVAEVHLRLADVLARLGRSGESALARETYERLRLEDFRRRAHR